MATVTLFAYGKITLGLTAKSILMKNTSDHTGESNSSLHGNFSAQIDNCLLTAMAEFTGSTRTTINKNLGNK